MRATKIPRARPGQFMCPSTRNGILAIEHTLYHGFHCLSQDDAHEVLNFGVRRGHLVYSVGLINGAYSGYGLNVEGKRKRVAVYTWVVCYMIKISWPEP